MNRKKTWVLLTVALLPMALFAFTVDAQTTRIFWAEGDYPAAPGKIGVTNADGTGQSIIHNGLAFVENLDIDPANQHIYWIERTGGGSAFNTRIRRSNFDGTGIVDLLNIPNIVSGLSLDLTNSKMYWTQGNSSGPATLHRADLSGASVQTLLSGFLAPALEADPASGKVFWGHAGAVHYANLNGTSPQQLYSSPADLILGLTVDPANDVYWTSAQAISIGVRVGDQAGSGFQALPLSSPAKSLGIDYEPVLDQVYWTEKDTGHLMVYDTTSSTDHIVLSGLLKPSDVAVYYVPEPNTLVARCTDNGYTHRPTPSKANPARIKTFFRYASACAFKYDARLKSINHHTSNSFLKN